MPVPAFIEVPRQYARAIREHRKGDAEQILAQLKREDPLSKETRGCEVEVHLLGGRLQDASAIAAKLCRLIPGSLESVASRAWPPIG
jgi:hypothetical protein